MKNTLIAILALTLPGAATAQFDTSDYYFDLGKITQNFVSGSQHDDGSYDIRFGQTTYHFNPDGKFEESDKHKLTTGDFYHYGTGNVNAVDYETNTAYILAPEVVVGAPCGFGVIMIEDLVAKERKYVHYSDADEKQFNKLSFYSGSTFSYKNEDGDMVFLMANGGTSALGPGEVAGINNDYLKRYVYHPASKTVEQSVHLTNKLKGKSVKSIGDPSAQYRKHGLIMGKLENKLFLLYDYAAENGQQTFEIWSFDLIALTEEMIHSSTIAVPKDFYMSLQMSSSSDDAKSGLMYNAHYLKPAESKGKDAVYQVFWIKPDLTVEHIELIAPAEKEEGVWFSPPLRYHVGENKLHFFTTTETAEKREMRIMTYENGHVETRIEHHTDMLTTESYALFFDERAAELLEAYRNVVYKDEREKYTKYKTGAWFVDENRVAHLFIVEYLTARPCTSCPFEQAHIRVITGILE
jgi:hypothetical protein